MHRKRLSGKPVVDDDDRVGTDRGWSTSRQWAQHTLHVPIVAITTEAEVHPGREIAYDPCIGELCASKHRSMARSQGSTPTLQSL